MVAGAEEAEAEAAVSFSGAVVLAAAEVDLVAAEASEEAAISEDLAVEILAVAEVRVIGKSERIYSANISNYGNFGYI